MQRFPNTSSRSLMRSFALLICVLSFTNAAIPQATPPSTPSTEANPVRQTSSPAQPQTGITEAELKEFTALEPIDAHTHIYRNDAVFSAMLERLHLHVLDVLVVDVNDDANHRTFEPLKQGAWQFVSSNPGHAS